MDLSVRRGAAGWAADKAAPHRPSFLPVLSRPSLLESPGVAASPSTPIREHPSDILSPVTESSSLLKSIYQTTERAAQVTSVTLDPSTESGSSRSMLHAYLRERAVLDTAIKRQQYSFSSDASPGSSHLPPGESQPQPQEQGPAEAHEGKGGEKVSSQAPLITTPNTTITSSTSTTTSALTLTPTMTSTTTSTATIVTSIQLSSSTVNSTSRMPTPPANLTVMNSGRGLDTKTAFLVPSGVLPSSLNRLTSDDGKCKCTFCHKEFNRPAQLSLHMNIHYMERPFRCDSCAVSFRTNGHLQKHKRSVGHFNKVNMNMTFGTPSTDNPRPFKCHDCKIAFRIHGHLAKHLRSKMHIMKLECLGKLPFGTYAEIERSGANLNEIDTTDCDNSLESLQAMASRLYEKDPTKLAAWKTQEDPPHHRVRTVSNSSTNSDDYPLQDDQDDPMAGCGHDEDTEGDDDEEVAGPRDGAGHGSLPGGAGDTHTQALPSTEMGLSPPASLLACHLCQEKFFEPEHLSSHLYSVHKVSVTYR
ncbi:Zinc finger protein 558 [Chionoecetes opilio]|uniref:Zinc finger protein 558 n=1 Tax=Chionoecetes opilio TaxID=41210 RepID=A0A8J5C9I7_CHIOP|nr:Zinc finger protein 558 [Chionoecetes opilio]